jgi:hypothetical protein
MHLPHSDETPFPSASVPQFKEDAISTFHTLFDVAIRTLQGMGLLLNGSEYTLVDLLAKKGEHYQERTSNTDTNMCLFRYNDDRKIYKEKQKCMIHQDSGLITFLPRYSLFC